MALDETEAARRPPLPGRLALSRPCSADSYLPFLSWGRLFPSEAPRSDICTGEWHRVLRKRDSGIEGWHLPAAPSPTAPHFRVHAALSAGCPWRTPPLVGPWPSLPPPSPSMPLEERMLVARELHLEKEGGAARGGVRVAGCSGGGAARQQERQACSPQRLQRAAGFPAAAAAPAGAADGGLDREPSLGSCFLQALRSQAGQGKASAAPLASLFEGNPRTAERRERVVRQVLPLIARPEQLGAQPSRYVFVLDVSGGPAGGTQAIAHIPGDAVAHEAAAVAHSCTGRLHTAPLRPRCRDCCRSLESSLCRLSPCRPPRCPTPPAAGSMGYFAQWSLRSCSRISLALTYLACYIERALAPHDSFMVLGFARQCAPILGWRTRGEGYDRSAFMDDCRTGIATIRRSGTRLFTAFATACRLLREAAGRAAAGAAAAAGTNAVVLLTDGEACDADAFASAHALVCNPKFSFKALLVSGWRVWDFCAAAPHLLQCSPPAWVPRSHRHLLSSPAACPTHPPPAAQDRRPSHQPLAGRAQAAAASALPRRRAPALHLLR